MSKELTIAERRLPGLAALCVLVAALSLFGASSNASEHPRCATLLENGQSRSNAWPPAIWTQFLDSVARQSSFKPPTAHLPDKVLETSPLLNDHRIYNLHRYVRKFGESFYRTHAPPPGLALPGSHYENLASFLTYGNENVSVTGVFNVLRSKATGHTFTLPETVLKSLDQKTQQDPQALNQILERADAISRSSVSQPQLDSFFARLETQHKKSPAEQKFDPYLPAAHAAPAHVERVVVDYDADRDIKRYATRETRRQGNLLISILDSDMSIGQHRLHEYPAPTATEVANGKAKQRAWLDSVLPTVYDDYVNRRGWTQDFVTHDYQEAIATASSTRYIIVQALDHEAKPGKVLAVMGLNRASYGSYTKYDSQKSEWLQKYGAFGKTYEKEHYLTHDPRYDDESLRLELPLLKMEHYLGVRLDRPSSVDQITFGDPGKPAESAALEFTGAELTGQGTIYEPVKFYLARKEDLRGTAFTELYRALIESLFPKTESPQVRGHSQWLYTFNPLREGKLLYAGRGFRPVEGQQPILKDGIQWSIFSTSPEDFLRKFHEIPAAELESEAARFIQMIRTNAKAISAPTTQPGFQPVKEAADSVSTRDPEKEKNIDDHCWSGYVKAAGRCNSRHPDDEHLFDECLRGVKKDLFLCCSGGGSPKCADP